MISDRSIQYLVIALVALSVVYAVVSAGFLLIGTGGANYSAVVLRITGLSLLVLVVSNALLLLACLAIRSTDRAQ